MNNNKNNLNRKLDDNEIDNVAGGVKVKEKQVVASKVKARKVTAKKAKK